VELAFHRAGGGAIGLDVDSEEKLVTTGIKLILSSLMIALARYESLIGMRCMIADPLRVLSGVAMDDPFLLPRSQLVDEVCDGLQQPEPVVIVTAPPASGKSSLINLLAHKLGTSKCLVVNCLAYRGEYIRDFIQASTKQLFQALQQQFLYLFLDDAFTLYANDYAALMYFLKTDGKLFRIGLFSSYYADSPERGAPVGYTKVRCPFIG